MRLALALAALTLAACGDPAPEPSPPPPDAPAQADDGRQSVADVVATSPRLRTLSRLLDASGLRATLADTSTAYTLFAPSDDAFAALGAADVAALEADSAAARDLLLGHVLGTRMFTLDVFPDLSIETLAGTEVAFAEAGEGLAVRSGGTTARVTDADLDADNGVVHIVDAVLTP